MDDDEQYETPPAVIGAIAAGVATLPFLVMYAILFLARSLIYPVSPPDITSSRAGEASAGFIALLLAIVVGVTVHWFSSRRWRWPFVVVQVATLVTAIDFLVDSSTGPKAVPLVLALTSATALGLAFTPAAQAHMRPTGPSRHARDSLSD